MSMVSELKKKVLAGIQIGREEAMGLQAEPLEELAAAADEIREHFCGNAFEREMREMLGRLQILCAERFLSYGL